MELAQLSLQYKPLIDALAALLSPVIAATVAFIAYQQWRTNRQKEKREVRQSELSVYYRSKRFLRSVDDTREIRLDLFEEFSNAVAEADFLFPPAVCEWLSSVEGAARDWLDGQQRIDLWKVEGNDSAADWVTKEQAYMEKNIDALQEAHCELLREFRPHVGNMN